MNGSARNEYRHPDAAPSCPGLPVSGFAFRHYRRTIIMSAMAFFAGAIGLIVNSPLRDGFLAPGPLSSPHAQILKQAGEEKCRACHETGSLVFSELLTAAFGGASPESKCQSDLCMDCHQTTIPLALAQMPHNLPADRLASMTHAILQQSSSGRRFPARLVNHQPVSPDSHTSSQIACNTCHREHHGADFNLSALTDAQCQACHARRFASFEENHPDFRIAAGSDQSSISFDHAQHSIRHFPARNQEFSCRSCHPNDPSGHFQTVASFEQMCSSCHSESLAESQRQGLELISIPMLDVSAVEESGYFLPRWPLSAIGDFDGKIPPLMRTMLMADLNARQAIQSLSPDFDFSDLDPANPEHMRQIVVLATAISDLMMAIQQKGNTEIVDRMSIALELPEDRIRKMLPEMDSINVQSAAVAWFADNSPAVSQIPPGIVETGRAWITSNEPLLRLQEKTEWLAENPAARLRSSPELSIQPDSTGQFVDPTISESSGLALQQSGSQTGSSSVAQEDDFLWQAGVVPAASGGELLAGNPVTGNLAGLHLEQARSTGESGQKTSTELAENLASRRSQGNALSIGIANQSAETPAASSFFSSPRKEGWVRDDIRPRILWHSDSPHRNGLIEAWIAEGKGHLFGSAENCLDCHSGMKGDAGKLWKSGNPFVAPRGFTRFSHAPHRVLAECETCHRIDSGSLPRSSTPVARGVLQAMTDSPQLRTGLLPLTPVDCSSCHHRNAAPSNCTTCHNYHVTGTATELIPAIQTVSGVGQ